MSDYKVKPITSLKGELDLPGDKSISHRAIMIGSIAEGKTAVKNFVTNQDCLSTVNAFKQMGIDISVEDDKVFIHGKGLKGLSKPKSPLYLGNSGTTMRLLLGILAGQGFDCTLTGDESLSSRPMSRVTHPLRSMGARIDGAKDAEFAPLTIKGGKLKPISFDMPVPSAQVKSSILFAGLYADGTTSVKEKIKSRDHTERMLKLFGADLTTKDNVISVKSNPSLSGKNITIPGDISSASFFIVGATLLKGSSIKVRSILYNPTRIGLINLLKRMGAKIEVINENKTGFEPTCDLNVESSPLRGIDITEDLIPSLIDELPIIMVAAALSKGKTCIKGAKELRVKETDRISSIATNLKRMGADITVKGDDIVIKGVERLNASSLESFGDHRTAMSMVIASLNTKGISTVSDIGCIDTSYPGFFSTLKTLTLA